VVSKIKLVLQNPNEESASVLLERIKEDGKSKKNLPIFQIIIRLICKSSTVIIVSVL
jgi:hypothetical protein